MEATVLLPEVLVVRLEKLAEEEGTSLGGLIRRLVSEHLEHRKPTGNHSESRKTIDLPLIPKSQTGVIMPVAGKDLDEIFACDDLAS
jgi:hypothetical protein